LREAEGYLELGLAAQALDTLARLTDPGTFRGHLLYVQGEALRALERWSEAADVLEQAADLMPSNIPMWLALGWCQKRAGHLDAAIHALERARDVDPSEAVIHYNLACYHSLARRKHDALLCLSRALELQPEMRDSIGDESDFDPLRSDPDFQALTSIIV
jgi:Flp pilus assembly protein TadD